MQEVAEQLGSSSAERGPASWYLEHRILVGFWGPEAALLYLGY